MAVVIADGRYKAQDALEFIEVDYEPLDVVMNMEAAIKDDAPLVHEDLGTNTSSCGRWKSATSMAPSSRPTWWSRSATSSSG